MAALACCTSLQHRRPMARARGDGRKRRPPSLLLTQAFNQLFSVLLHQRAQKCHRKVKEDFRLAVFQTDLKKGWRASSSPAAPQLEQLITASPLCTNSQSLMFIVFHYFGELCVLACLSQLLKTPSANTSGTLQPVTNASTPVHNTFLRKHPFVTQRLSIRRIQ